MPLTYVTGDPLLTRSQVLAFGHNLKGRTEVGAFETLLLDLYPAAFATYGKLCRNGRVKAGGFWVWRESAPQLAFMVVRESSVGATRVRFVESVVMTLARDYRLHSINSLALIRPGDGEEWPAIKPVVDYWLKPCPLPVVVYEAYAPGVQAEDGLSR
jgi:hypothetical protein